MTFTTLHYHTRTNGYSMPTYARNAEINADPTNNAYRSDTNGGVWTNVSSSFPTGGLDDTYVNTPIPIGFDWGWGGSTYSNWYFNTNGHMLFSNLQGWITPQSTSVAILANPGDLWFDSSLSATEYTSNYGSYPDPNLVGPLPSLDVNLVTLQDTYKIRFDQSENYGPVAPGASDMWFNSTKDATVGTWPHSISMVIIGYTNNSGVYTGLSSPKLIKIVPWHRSYFSRSGAIYEPLGIASFRVTYIGTLKSDHPVYDTSNSVWQKNISWTDNGVQHNILRVVVRCGFYSAHDRSAGYRISLYKCGAEQKFSISLLDWDSGIGNTSSKLCGPWPMASSDTGLRAYSNWMEQTWESYDNGSTWTFFNPGAYGTAWSTVVNSGAPVYSTASNVSLQTLTYLISSARGVTYGETIAPTYPSSTYKPGLGLVTTLLKVYLNSTATDSFQQSIMNICNELAPDGYKYGDVNNSGLLDLSDVLDVQKIYLNKTPSFPESTVGTQELVNKIVSQGTAFTVDAIKAGYIIGPTASMDILYSNFLSRTLAAKSNVKISGAVNRGPLALSTVAPHDIINSYVNFKPNKYSGLMDENF